MSDKSKAILCLCLGILIAFIFVEIKRLEIENEKLRKDNESLKQQLDITVEIKNKTKDRIEYLEETLYNDLTELEEKINEILETNIEKEN